MRVLQFDKFGRYIKDYASVTEARSNSGCKNVIRCLFREAVQTNGCIFAFEGDERILENGNLDVVDCIVQYEASGTLPFATYKTIDECPDPSSERLSVKYKQLDQKFDSKSFRVECWFGDKKKIGVFDNVAEARKVTGSPCIWANIFGECKTTNGLVFKKEEIPF